MGYRGLQVPNPVDRFSHAKQQFSWNFEIIYYTDWPNLEQEHFTETSPRKSLATMTIYRSPLI
jgi:hypothetical protein